jgi:hypothetical protein
VIIHLLVAVVKHRVVLAHEDIAKDPLCNTEQRIYICGEELVQDIVGLQQACER